ncbi:MAG: [protein-PII] uridylyltransferase [Gammaproteobacteria bacterium]
MIYSPASPCDNQLFDEVALAKKLQGHKNHLKVFSQALKQANQILTERFNANEDILSLVHQRGWFVDQVLVNTWRRYIKGKTEGIALIAVGGYGRGELHPGSDIDLLILLNDKDQNEYHQHIETFLMFLWDIGLEVGHSVRTLSQCVEISRQDITVATNLMEARLLEGDNALFLSMREKTGPDHLWSGKDFFEAKWNEQIDRHEKYGDSAYNLEPNVKEGPGGLRDIQMIGWVAKRHFGTDSLHGLIDHSFLTESEYSTLIEGQEFLWRVRFALHIQAKRREDRLLFDFQQDIAERLGYINENSRLAVEHFMKDYYRTITEISRLNEMLLQLFQEELLYSDHPVELKPINKRFRARNDFIEITDNNVFRKYPFALLEIFLLLQQHPELKGVRASTIRLIRNHRHHINEKFRNDFRCISLFLEIFRQPQGLTHELRRMNRYGILAAYLPAFEQIVGQMQYDLFHVYTVDEHTITVIRNLRRFTVPEFMDEFPLCSELVQRIPKQEILHFAALFHDIAKGRGGNHSELGAEDALIFCHHHGLSQYDSHFISWLVKNHLLMSMTAQKQDISDPGVISTFASVVRDQIHLDCLYLLTVADMRATNPKLWNNWKDSLLIELYESTKRALRRGLENPIDKHELINETRNQAYKILETDHPENKALSKTNIDSFWKNIDDSYFLRHSADEIAWHIYAIKSIKDNKLPLVLIREETERGGTEIFIYTHDKEYLFATAVLVLDQLNLNIQDARIITTKEGFTLDTFFVLDTSGRVISDPLRIQEIQSTLTRAISSEQLNISRVNRRQTRRVKHFPMKTDVSFSVDEDSEHTVMEINTCDRPGLLANIGRALIECDVRIQNAKIATLGARVEDIFYITGKDYQNITNESVLEKLRGAIIRHLDSPTN